MHKRTFLVCKSTQTLFMLDYWRCSHDSWPPHNHGRSPCCSSVLSSAAGVTWNRVKTPYVFKLLLLVLIVMVIKHLQLHSNLRQWFKILNCFRTEFHLGCRTNHRIPLFSFPNSCWYSIFLLSDTNNSCVFIKTYNASLICHLPILQRTDTNKKLFSLYFEFLLSAKTL